MKEIYYYIRDKENRPMTTVCLLEKRNFYDLNLSTEIAKGIAFCSEIALERAKYALDSKKDSCAIYMPILTEYETKLLNFEKG